jgi:restriction endonuclease Mrr
MAIPDFQTLMLPVLRCLSDGKEHTLRDLVAAMSGKRRFRAFGHRRRKKKRMAEERCVV